MFNKKEKKLDNNERPSLVTLTRPSSVIAEQFRTIRTNIQFSMVDKNLKTLVITSAGPGAGKSTISANLAVTFAMQGKKVLIVDADMRKPTVHKTFRLPNRDGLTTLLTERDVEIKDIAHRLDTEGLFVITSGVIPPNPSELLASNRMNQLMSEFEELFDLIIFDMPPVIAVTDAQVMSSKTDGTIFVVNKDGADKEMVTKSKNLLEKVNANVIGVVLNRVELKGDNYYYYYGEE
ncbi:putative polysaccharide biosynthesis protein, chain length determination [Carnobacterium sp. 17-4]|uniref:CpsD/CapB family tyrosine-protein kinase n=1 Tax=Carnobacterium sp. (strain 17-4) TaxID=208596 RepID=UPI0002058DEF|nr:CpsD/CapB family tyrosine-protein kinase [Carnobacterium sp. 17-4]AEB30209.1 putative polysaccharide biosynthesis protein, chain length determination [Carnobacterium sp. 17-4]